MVSRKTHLRVLLLIVASAGTSRAAAQTVDPAWLAAGYEKLHAGDDSGAIAYFGDRARIDTSNVPARFAWLLARYEAAEGERPPLGTFEADLDRFLEAVSARYTRQPTDSEALFYLACGHFLRARYRVDYDRGMWGAARDGAKMKHYSEQYVRRYPNHGDAYLVLGAYNYYVELAPVLLKALRALLFIPSGDRAKGLQQLERAVREGQLFAPFAATMLAESYAWYEGRGEDALRMGRLLRDRHPTNPRVHLLLGEIYESPVFEDYDLAASSCERAVDLATNHAGTPATVKYRGMLRLAVVRAAQWRLGDAARVLDPIVQSRPSDPAWVWPQAVMLRTRLRVLQGMKDEHLTLEPLLKDSSRQDWHKPARELLTWASSRRASGEAPIYEALIPANRLTAERTWDEARQAYEAVAQSAPTDWQVRYRLAHLELMRGALDRAEPLLRVIVDTRDQMPAWIRPRALLDLARATDLRGHRSEALKFYRRVVNDFERDPAAGAARIGLLTPYRGRRSAE